VTDETYEEYDFDPDRTEYDGFMIGDQIAYVVDDEDLGVCEGEEGQVVGFATIPAAKHPEIAIAFGNDPRERVAMYVLMDGSDLPIEAKYDDVETI